MNILKKEKFFVYFLIIFFLLFTNHLCCNTVAYSNNLISNNIISNNAIKNTIYINWILKHSSKISRRTATNIYKATMSLETENRLLYLALMCIESNFNPSAVSKKGAVGLTQIMPKVWAKELQKQGIIKEKKDLFDYDKSLLASNYILTKYYKKTGSWTKALQKYVGKKNGNYAKNVLAIYGELQLLNNVEKTIK